MARRRTARSAAGDSGKKPVKRGRRTGRKPGTWTLTSPEAIRAFRDTHKVSCARLGARLGVSATSVGNWETGVVATPKFQEKLADVLKQGAAAFPRTIRGGVAGHGPGVGGPATTATGVIVVGYLASAKKAVSQEDLLGLIRCVKGALA